MHLRFFRLFLTIPLSFGLLCFSLVSAPYLHAEPKFARAAACPPDGCKIFLPVLLRYIDQVSNGGFESGPVAWKEYSALGFFSIYSFPGEPQRPPHSGSWEAWLGGEDEETASIDQNIYVSSAHPILQYWQWIVSDEPDCSKDKVAVLVDALVLSLRDLCQSTSTTNWEMRLLDLSAYSGRLVNLKFLVSTDANLGTISSFYLDDISLQASP